MKKAIFGYRTSLQHIISCSFGRGLEIMELKDVIEPGSEVFRFRYSEAGEFRGEKMAESHMPWTMRNKFRKYNANV